MIALHKRTNTMTEDEMNPAICSSALQEDGTLDPEMIGQTDAYGTPWGQHRWDDSTDPVTCAECGTEKDEHTAPETKS